MSQSIKLVATIIFMQYLQSFHSLFLYVLTSTNVVAVDIILRHIKDLVPIEIAYHVIATIGTSCDIILVVAVLKIINEVSLAQKYVLSVLLKHKDEAHNTFAELVVFLKAYHSLEGTGYKLFGIPTKAMKTLLFASFVSLSAFIGGILFNESWSQEGTCRPSIVAPS